LKSELPGILGWMLEGCADWLEQGLAPPQIVTEATAEYLQDEDAVAAWIEDCAARDPNAFEKNSALFASFSEWAEKSGEHIGSRKRFSQSLETRGFRPHRDRELGRGFYGIRLPREDYLWGNRGRDTCDTSADYRLSARA
jgi:putative DNA primase/helicase